MKQKRSLEEAKRMAHDLFMRTEKSQKEIASLCGVGVDTIGEWIRKGKWRELKAANSVTRSRVIADTLLQLAELDKTIMARAQKYPSASEADIKIKLKEVIKDLDKSLSLPDYFSYSEEFLTFLNGANHDLCVKVSTYVNEFVQSKVQQLYR